ncbi:RraA family protein [Streptomyces puniciscabiei]
MSFYSGPDFARPHPDFIRRFASAEAATLGHMTDFGFPRGLSAQTSFSGSFAGPALTVKIPHMDSTAVHCAVDEVRPGDVLVIDQSGDEGRSSFGGALAAVARSRGVVAVVSNGSTNDIQEIQELELPLFSRGRTALTTRIIGVEGAIRVPVSIGGVVVCPGDIVFGDVAGIAVIPSDEAESRLEEILARQESFRRRNPAGRAINGEKLADLSGARQKFTDGNEAA